MGDKMAINHEAILNVEGINKHYPNGVEAVKDLSLTVCRGEVFGLVGPNGAGKSTLLKLIAGLLRPERGRVTVAGHDITGKPPLAARFVGLMPDPLGVYTDISCREYLQFFGMVYGLKGEDLARRIAHTVELLELGPWMNAEAETLSAGWQRRLALGRILLLETPLLLLDEPAAGLDIRARSELLGIVRNLTGAGRTVVISSHILPELEELADRFGVMDNGRWVDIAAGHRFATRDEIRHGIGRCQWSIECGDAVKAHAALEAAGVDDVGLVGDSVVFTSTDDQIASAHLATVVSANISVTGFRRIGTGLSDVVMKVLEGEAK